MPGRGGRRSTLRRRSILCLGLWRGMGRLRACLGLCRVGCTRICGRSRRSGWGGWICRGMRLGGWAVGEPREVTREMIARTLEHLPKDKPRYVMGVGYPDEIEEYARMGVDMMDCVLPTRAARHGLVFRAAEPGETEGNAAVRMNIKRTEFME